MHIAALNGHPETAMVGRERERQIKTQTDRKRQRVIQRDRQRETDSKTESYRESHIERKKKGREHFDAYCCPQWTPRDCYGREREGDREGEMEREKVIVIDRERQGETDRDREGQRETQTDIEGQKETKRVIK